MKDVHARPRILRYAVAVLATGIAELTRLALTSLLALKFPLITFYPAVMVSAWYGGLGPGLLATAISAAIVDYVWLEPLHSMRISAPGDFVALLLFVGIGVTIAALNQSLHRGRASEHAARERAERGEAEMRRVQERLQATLTAAERANQAKDRFLATVSHELRTPLNAMLGWADMLRTGGLSEDRRAHALRAIYTNAKRQARLVDDLLDAARIMSGKLRLERTGVDLHHVVRAALDVVQPAAGAKHIRIAVNVSPSLGAFFADGPRLQQVLWNLLSNAIKFTPENGDVRVGVRRTDRQVEIRVTDNGRGIPPECLQAVFDPFRQVDEPTIRSNGGLGLGLSIVRYLVEAHGGVVRAESAGEGRGSTFVITLPIVAVQPDSTERRRAHEHRLAAESCPSPLTGVSVLVVDDDADSRAIVTETLERQGARVFTAASSAGALDTLSREHADVLLADIAMPGEDGYTLIRRVRSAASSRTASIPAAALTSFAREEDRRRALHAGYQLHLAKPVEPWTLVEAVVALASRHAALAESTPA